MKDLNPVVIRNILTRANKGPGYQSIRTGMLLVGGGTYATAVGIGQLLALIKTGLINGIDYIITISASGPVSLAVDAAHDPLELFEECLRLVATPEYICFSVKRLLGTPVDNHGYLKKLSRVVGDFRRRSDRFERRVVVSTRRGETKLFDPWTASPSAYDAFLASMAVPWFCKPVYVNGDLHRDGGINPLPIDEIMREFPDLTDLLVMPMSAYGPIEAMRPTFADRAYTCLIGLFDPLAFRPVWNRWPEFRNGLRKIEMGYPGLNIGVMWHPRFRDSIAIWTTDYVKLRRACQATEHRAIRDLKRALAT